MNETQRLFDAKFVTLIPTGYKIAAFHNQIIAIHPMYMPLFWTGKKWKEMLLPKDRK